MTVVGAAVGFVDRLLLVKSRPLLAHEAERLVNPFFLPLLIAEVLNFVARVQHYNGRWLDHEHT